MVDPRHVYLVVAKHVTRYLEGKLDYGLKYTTENEFKLCGYSNSDWEGSVEYRRALQDVVLVWDQM